MSGPLDYRIITYIIDMVRFTTNGLVISVYGPQFRVENVGDVVSVASWEEYRLERICVILNTVGSFNRVFFKQ